MQRDQNEGARGRLRGSEKPTARSIPAERRAAYYVGLGLMLVGLLLFLSVFVTYFAGSGDVSSFESRARSGLFRALAGMGLLVVGRLVRTLGARGLAGSGIVLDPEQARRDLEPYSRMAGGMIGDALSEARVDLGKPPAVVIRCRACQELNEEDSKFCQECGKAL